MILKVKEILRLYSENFNKQKEEFEKYRDKALKTYSTEYAGEAISMLTLEYNKMSNEAITTAKNDINNVFENAKQALCNSVTTPMPEEFVSELAPYKTMNLTQVEFNLLVDKYKDNYMAVKTLKELAKNNNIPILTYTVDDKLEELEKMRLYCLDCINAYQGTNTSYRFENLIRGTVIDTTCENLNIYVKTV